MGFGRRGGNADAHLEAGGTQTRTYRVLELSFQSGTDS
jgi:hypothetical protein